MGNLHEVTLSTRNLYNCTQKHYEMTRENELLALKDTQQAYICDIDEIKNHNRKLSMLTQINIMSALLMFCTR